MQNAKCKISIAKLIFGAKLSFARIFKFSRIILVLVIVSVLFKLIHAINLDDEGFSKGGASYLALGNYTKAVAMGRAYASVATGSGGFFYNPAGLGFTHAMEFSSMSTVLGLDRKLYSMGFVMPVISACERLPEVFEKEPGFLDKIFSKKTYRQYGFGLAYTDFGISGIEGRDEWGNKTSDFDDKEKMLAAGFGYRLFGNFSLGIGLKYLKQELEKAKATATGLDLGIIYKIFDNRCSIGVAASDLFSEFSWKVPNALLGSEYSYKEAVPEKYSIGLSLVFNDGKGIFSADLNKTQYAGVW